MNFDCPRALPAAHGGNVIELAAALGLEALDFLDFSSNANSLVDDLTEAVVRETPHFHSVYPDTHSAALRERLAQHEGVAADHIMVGNGSSELIFLAFMALKPRSVLLVAPIFSEYVLACANMNIYYELLTLSEENGFRITESDMERLSSTSYDCVVLCTPNNPTGAVYDMETVLPRLSCSTVLVDNTYKEFLYGDPAYQGHSQPAYARMLRPGVRCIALNSFTKFFHCTGIRLGYCLADPGTIGGLQRFRAPWMVSRFNELTGIKLLEHLEDYRRRQGDISLYRDAMRQELMDTNAFQRICDSPVNFLTAKLRPEFSATALYDFLLQRKILIRVCDNIPGMPEGHIRIQVRSPQDNNRLLTAIREFTSKAVGDSS